MILADEAATADLGSALAAIARPGDVITLAGPLGAGKTTLARSFLVALGQDGEVPSPTFTIVQPYEDLDPPVWHVDLYRIEDASEIEELGIEAAEDGVLLVEWPERARDETWHDALRLTFDFAADGERILTAIVPPSWEDRWPPR